MELLPFIQQNWLYFGAAAVLVILIVANEINLLRSKKFSIDIAKTLNETNAETAVVIDLRSQDDYKKGHIPTAINIPYQNAEDKLKDLSPYTDKKIILYAVDETRANQLCLKLRKMDTTSNIYTLSGGLSAWMEANLPLAKGKK